MGGNPETPHVEAVTHQELLEFLARLSRPHRQTPLFVQGAPAGPNAFTAVEAAVAGIRHLVGTIVDIDQDCIEPVFGT